MVLDSSIKLPIQNRPQLETDEKKTILNKLYQTALFEAYLNKKYMGVTRFSLEGDTYAEDELGLAINMLTALRDRPTGLLFHLTPREVGGAISYHLYAGPATDAVEAENLKAPLEEILIREDPESWSIRDTPLAFSLGRRETLVEAQEYLAIADLQGAFGYIVQVSFPDGTVGYEILSGAFQTPEDAGWWRLVLQEAGFPDLPLIERRGRPPE